MLSLSRLSPSPLLCLAAILVQLSPSATPAAESRPRPLRPDHPVLVFESDDWGEVSADSAATLKSLAQEGYLPDSNWAKDCAETVDDLERLYRLLERHADSRGRHPVFTANLVVSDPDFEAIEKSGFTLYRCLPVSKVFPDRYALHGDLVAKWKEGLSRRVFVPQLHAREHFNVPYWMATLHAGDPMARTFFRHHLVPLNWGQEGLRLLGDYVDMSVVPSRPILFDEQLARTTDAQKMFESIMGYRSISSVAPAYRFDDLTERALARVGVRIIAGGDRETEAIQADGEYVLGLREFGQKSLTGGVYLVRNVDLEPIGRSDFQLTNALEQVRKAFQSGEPAIVNTHRINYVSATDPAFAREGLSTLETFLNTVEREYPDVCYATTPEIGESLLAAPLVRVVSIKAPAKPTWRSVLNRILPRDDSSPSLLAGNSARPTWLVAGGRAVNRLAKMAKPRMSPPASLKNRRVS